MAELTMEMDLQGGEGAPGRAESHHAEQPLEWKLSQGTHGSSGLLGAPSRDLEPSV